MCFLPFLRSSKRLTFIQTKFPDLLAPAYLASVTFVLNSRRGLRALVDASLIDGPALGTSVVARPSCPHTCGGSDHQIPESPNGPSIVGRSLLFSNSSDQVGTDLVLTLS